MKIIKHHYDFVSKGIKCRTCLMVTRSLRRGHTRHAKDCPLGKLERNQRKEWRESLNYQLEPGECADLAGRSDRSDGGLGTHRGHAGERIPRVKG
jgi:hypothetical protein